VTDGAQTLPRHHISDTTLGLLDDTLAVTRRRVKRKLLFKHSEVLGSRDPNTNRVAHCAGALIRT
jgi:hypothetical protein